MKVKEIMTRDVICISPSEQLKDIYRIFCEKKIGGVPVVDEKKNILGIVTKKELLAALLPDYFDMIDDFLFIDDFGELEKILESIPELRLFIAEDLMMRKVITIDEDASVMKVPALMNKYGVRRVPVVKEGKLVGIITRTDICRALFNNSKH